MSRVSRATAAATAAVVASQVVWATPAAAHGFGGRSDLPVPFWMFAYGAAAALLISFAGLAVFWRSPRMEGARPGRVLAKTGRGWARVAFLACRAAGLASFLIVTAAAAFGDSATTANIAPVFVYVVFWVGVTVVCALVGDVWRLFNPFDTIAAGVARLVRRPARSTAPAGGRLSGYWPAVVGLGGFLWLELVYPDRAEPRALAVAIVAYTVAVAVAVARNGREWVERGEAFTAFFGVLSHMAPLHAEGGRLRLRPPLVGLAGLDRRSGLDALVLVALGATTFDGVSRSQIWLDFTASLDRWALAGVATIGLAWSVAMVAIIYSAAMRVTGRLYERDHTELSAAFVHSLVPIAFAYAVAHYFSLLVFEGQGAIALASDPFGLGWNLWGSADRAIDYTVVSTTTVAYVQAGGIVVGHVAGVVVAHDRALALFPGRHAARSQYPLLVAMVLFTLTGLALLLGT